MNTSNMNHDENGRKGALKGYSHFLEERKLALPKQGL